MMKIPQEAQSREKRLRTINRLLLTVFALVAAGATLLALRKGDTYAASQAGLALAMLTFPALIMRLLRFYIPQDCRLLYYVFVFCSVVVGSSLYGYSRIPHWDKLLHFFSGLLIGAGGLITCNLLFDRLDGPAWQRRTLYVLFPFAFNLAVAALWEIYEYMLYILFEVDAVNTLTTGVNDTMQDMIVCLLGGLVFLLLELAAMRSGRKRLLIGMCAHFFAVRGRELRL